MKRHKLILIILFCLVHVTSYSQVELPKVKNTYLNFLREPSAESQNQLFTFNYQFIYSPWGKTLGSRGLMTNFGLNLGRLFSRKIFLSVVADIKLVPGIWRIISPNEFKTDLNLFRLTTFATDLDSVNSGVVRDALEHNYIYGNNIFNLGISFSLFPQKYGGIFIHVKRGSTGFQLRNVFENPYVNNGANDKVGMYVSGNWIYELSFKPAAFFRNTFTSYYDGDINFLNSIMISFYYEKLNFKSAEFNGTTIDKIVSQTFLNKYGVDNRFGFKIGIGLY